MILISGYFEFFLCLSWYAKTPIFCRRCIFRTCLLAHNPCALPLNVLTSNTETVLALLFLFPSKGCRELLSRTASRLLPGLCNDLRDWQEATRHKAAGLLPIVLLHIEAGVTQHTQLLVTGLANGVAEALLRITSATGGGSIHLILISPSRGLPCLSDLTTSRKLNPSVSVAPNAETSEALGVLQQLFAAARYVACFVEPEVGIFVNKLAS